MKQTIAMKQAAFEELMREHGFQYLGVVHRPAAAAANHICVFIPAPFMEDPTHSKSPPSKMRILSAP